MEGKKKEYILRVQMFLTWRTPTAWLLYPAHLGHWRWSVRNNYVRKFGKAKGLYPQPGGTRTKVGFRIEAQVLWNRIVKKIVNQMGCCPNKPNSWKDTQEKIPQGHASTPIPCRSISKVRLSAQNTDSIQRHSRNRNPGIFNHPISQIDGVILQFKPRSWIKRPTNREVEQQKSKLDLGKTRRLPASHRFLSSFPTARTSGKPCQTTWGVHKRGSHTALRQRFSRRTSHSQTLETKSLSRAWSRWVQASHKIGCAV